MHKAFSSPAVDTGRSLVAPNPRAREFHKAPSELCNQNELKVALTCFLLKYYQNLKCLRFYCNSTDLLAYA